MAKVKKRPLRLYYDAKRTAHYVKIGKKVVYLPKQKGVSKKDLERVVINNFVTGGPRGKTADGKTYIRSYGYRSRSSPNQAPKPNNFIYHSLLNRLNDVKQPPSQITLNVEKATNPTVPQTQPMPPPPLQPITSPAATPQITTQQAQTQPNTAATTVLDPKTARSLPDFLSTPFQSSLLQRRAVKPTTEEPAKHIKLETQKPEKELRPSAAELAQKIRKSALEPVVESKQESKTDPTTPEKALYLLGVADLRALAGKSGVNLNGASKKSQIIERLVNHSQISGNNAISKYLATNPTNAAQASEQYANVIMEQSAKGRTTEEEEGDFLSQLGGARISDGDGGLTSVQILSIMEDEIPKGFVGVIASDELNSLLPQIDDRQLDKFAFIMNKDPHNKPGSHWVACYVDLLDDKSICYYDPFAEDPADSFLYQLKSFVKHMKLPYYLKCKINYVKEQRENSSRCGYHAIRFVRKMLAGASFADSSRFSKVTECEQLAQKAEKKYGYL